jgi:hypothetical protein
MVRKSTGALLGGMLFFAGVVCGFLLAPIKKGISISNSSGNISGNYCGDDHISEPGEPGCGGPGTAA